MFIPCKIVSYADDTTLLISTDCFTNLQIQLLGILNLCCQWFTSNKLSVNIEKTSLIIFSKNIPDHFSLSLYNNTFKPVEKAKLLGVIIDDQLTFVDHIQEVIKKLNSALYTIRALKHICNKDTLKTIYYGYFESHIRYCLLLWGTVSDITKIFKLQKRAIRVIAGISRRTSCRQAFEELQIMTLFNLVIFERIMYVYDNKTRFNLNTTTHHYYIRNSQLRPALPHTERYKKSFLYNSITLFNNISISDELTSNRKKFAKNLKHFLLHHVYYSLDEFLQNPVNLL